MLLNPDFFTNTSAAAIGQLREAKRTLSDRYLTPVLQTQGAVAFAVSIASPDPVVNVVGVGIGEKLSDGLPTGILAVKFFVQVKYPDSQIPARSRLPKTVDGLPVDVEQTGRFVRFLPPAAAAAAAASPNPRNRFRPAQPGSSVGFKFPPPNDGSVMAGTFGALAKDDAQQYILSNNHVLADEGSLPLGAPIFQPGLLDGGKNTDRIARLTRFIPIDPLNDNTVDAAIAQVEDRNKVTNAILGIGPPKGTASAQFDMAVEKFGRTTAFRVGRVTSTATDIVVGYNTGQCRFVDQIIIVGRNNQPFSDAGDSGSLILERTTKNAVGLLFAGSATHTIANHIDDVLSALGVNLVV